VLDRLPRSRILRRAAAHRVPGESARTGCRGHCGSSDVSRCVCAISDPSESVSAGASPAGTPVSCRESGSDCARLRSFEHQFDPRRATSLAAGRNMADGLLVRLEMIDRDRPSRTDDQPTLPGDRSRCARNASRCRLTGSPDLSISYREMWWKDLPKSASMSSFGPPIETSGSATCGETTNLRFVFECR
jgi:hypothetical protein